MAHKEATKIHMFDKTISLLLYNTPRWSSWLDMGVLINVDTPGCGTSVVQGPTGHN